MGKGRRRYFSAAESAEIWDRWQRGDGLRLIGRVFGKPSSSIFAHLRPHGGIRPVPCRRSRRALSLAAREEISRGVAVGASLRSIAKRLGRAASSVSRELRRNGGSAGYRAAAADKRAWHQALRPKPCEPAPLPCWCIAGGARSCYLVSRPLVSQRGPGPSGERVASMAAHS
jgi:DNA-binding CsgD family transcriptional regulator